MTGLTHSARLGIPQAEMVAARNMVQEASMSLVKNRVTDWTEVPRLGRWGTYACPQCLPSDTVPIRNWTWTFRPPVIRHRHLPYHGCATVDAPSGYVLSSFDIAARVCTCWLVLLRGGTCGGVGRVAGVC